MNTERKRPKELLVLYLNNERVLVDVMVLEVLGWDKIFNDGDKIIGIRAMLIRKINLLRTKASIMTVSLIRRLNKKAKATCSKNKHLYQQKLLPPPKKD